MVLSDIKNCKNCALKGQFQNGIWGCLRTHLPINLETDFCSKASIDACTCDNCHQIILKGFPSYVVSADDEGYLTLCENCYNRI